MHVVCAWIGNTQAVAAEHCLQVTDEHLARAAMAGPKALQKAVQHRTEQRRRRVQGVPAESGQKAQSTAPQKDATPCSDRGLREVGQRGLEPPTSPLSGVRSSQLSY
jgi:hypothetical protein